MTKKFKAQVTTHRSYEAQEQVIYQAFLTDYGHDGADAIAKTNTAFQLRYMSPAEALDCLIRSGIPEDNAIDLVVAFSEARTKAEIGRMNSRPASFEDTRSVVAN